MNYDFIYNCDCIEGIDKYVIKGSADLIIADPPYFRIVNESWDRQWRTESDYLEWSTRWIKCASNALRIGGSFYLFGYFKMLSKLLPILENNGFELRQQIVIDKGIRAVSGRATKNYKMFPNVTESILFLYKDPKPFIKNFLKQRQLEIGISAREINELLGVKSNGGGMWSIYTGENICKQIPTQEIWTKLQKILNFNLQYDRISQTFNPQVGFTDVWTDIDFYSEQRIHPTQKPRKLIDRIILASSNQGDLVIDPFSGSGTVAESCIYLDRKYICFETDNNYYSKSLDRIDSVSNQLKMSRKLI